MKNIPNAVYPLGTDSSLYAYDSEIEYLQSTETQWIDTGIDPLSIGAIGFDIENTYDGELTGNHFGFGGFSSAGISAATTSRGRILCVMGSTASNLSVVNYIDYGDVSGSRTIYNSQRVTVNKHLTKIDSYPSKAISPSFYLFAARYTVNSVAYAAYTKSACRIRWFKIWDRDDNLIADLIPVRVSHTGYMFDKVSKKRFENVGRGTFILGPDITQS